MSAVLIFAHDMSVKDILANAALPPGIDIEDLVQCFTLKEAADTLFQMKPDILLCQASPPAESKYLLYILKASELTAEPVIMGCGGEYSELAEFIDAGVTRFVPAPMDASLLSRHLKAVLNIKNNEQQTEGTRLSYDKLNMRLRRLQHKTFYQDVIIDQENKEDTLLDKELLLLDYGVRFNEPLFHAICVTIDALPIGAPLPERFFPIIGLSELAEAYLQTWFCETVTYINGNSITLLLNYSDPKLSVPEICQALLRSLQAAISCYGNYAVTIGISQCSRQMFKIDRLVSEAKIAIGERLNIGFDKVIAYDSALIKAMDPDIILTEEKKERLRKSICAYDALECRHMVNEIIDTLSFENATPNIYIGVVELLNNTITETVNDIRRNFIRRGKQVSWGLNMPPLLDDLYSIEAVGAAECKWVIDVIDGLRQAVDSPEDSAARVIKLYIKEHLSEQISLNILAEQVSLTPSYVSAKFKQETGMSYTEYLMRVRINHAKELLAHSRDKISEIALACGFSDNRHFSRIFARRTGMTPSQFREIHFITSN